MFIDNINFVYAKLKPHISKDTYGNETVRIISRKIDVCGFISLSEIGSPFTLSRHLVLPRNEKENYHHHQHRSQENKSNMTELEKLDADMRNFYAKNSTDEKIIEDDETASSSSSAAHPQNEALKESVCVVNISIEILYIHLTRLQIF